MKSAPLLSALVLVALAALPIASEARAQGFSFEVRIGDAPPPVIVERREVVVVPPQPVVVMGSRFCGSSTVMVEGAWVTYYDNSCVMDHLSADVFEDRYARTTYLAAIADCRFFIGAVAHYDQVCMDRVQVSGVYFWAGVRAHHDNFYRNHNFRYSDRARRMAWEREREERRRREFERRPPAVIYVPVPVAPGRRFEGSPPRGRDFDDRRHDRRPGHGQLDNALDRLATLMNSESNSDGATSEAREKPELTAALGSSDDSSGGAIAARSAL